MQTIIKQVNTHENWLQHLTVEAEMQRHLSWMSTFSIYQLTFNFSSVMSQYCHCFSCTILHQPVVQGFASVLFKCPLSLFDPFVTNENNRQNQGNPPKGNRSPFGGHRHLLFLSVLTDSSLVLCSSNYLVSGSMRQHLMSSPSSMMVRESIQAFRRWFAVSPCTLRDKQIHKDSLRGPKKGIYPAARLLFAPLCEESQQDHCQSPTK